MKNTILATLIAPALLVACGGGGGGGGSSSPAAPGGMSYGTPIAAYVVKVSIEANVPTISGQVTSWSVTPALPAGLS
ncbi:MAG: kelch-like protein, partial [Planctomycetota bacterium]|nr:kelch-like protein [Planctomycetota bacterium]